MGAALLGMWLLAGGRLSAQTPAPLPPASAPQQVVLTLDRPQGSLALAVKVRQPPGPPRGVVLFLHGYMAQADDFAYTLDRIAGGGWVVAALDLPGHGSSDGPRYDIDDFATYGDAVALWLNWAGRQGWPGPRVLVAHSLGAAAALEALRRPETPRPDRVVFLAPLLWTDWYAGLSLADALVGSWLPTLGFRDYGARAHWFQKLEAWLDRIDSLRWPSGLGLTVYSGDRDQVVDEDRNHRALARMVPGLRWVTLPGKNHWFATDLADRQSFFEILEREELRGGAQSKPRP